MWDFNTELDFIFEIIPSPLIMLHKHLRNYRDSYDAPYIVSWYLKNNSITKEFISIKTGNWQIIHRIIPAFNKDTRYPGAQSPRCGFVERYFPPTTWSRAARVLYEEMHCPSREYSVASHTAPRYQFKKIIELFK